MEDPGRICTAVSVPFKYDEVTTLSADTFALGRLKDWGKNKAPAD